MTDSSEVVFIDVPARIADLAFRIAAPRDWISHPMPEEDVDFSVPTAFVPLVLVAAPWAAVVLTVAVRPAFEDGTVQDWSLFLLDSQGIRPTAIMPATIGNVHGLAGVGRQQQDDTWMEIRFAFFEDGGRFVYLGLFAPETISAPLESTWQTVLRDFVLARPQGQTVPVGPGMGIMPSAASEAPTAAEEAAAGSLAEESSASASIPRAPGKSEDESSAEPASFTREDFGFFAKADTADTLDPEHPTNAGLREQGIGFSPNILATDTRAKVATIGAGAIRAVIRVALGWFVNDDGRRTLLLDPDDKIQISLQLLQTEGRTAEQVLDACQHDAEQSYESPEFVRFASDGISMLAVRNIAVNDEPVEQLHMLTAWAHPSAMLRARVTADPASTPFAADYAALILKSADYGEQRVD